MGGWADAAGQPSGTVMRYISERSEKEGWCFSKKACCAHVCTRAIFQAFHQLVQIGSAYYLSIFLPLSRFPFLSCSFPVPSSLLFPPCPSTCFLVISDITLSLSVSIHPHFPSVSLSPPPLQFTSGALVRAVSPRQAPRARKHPLVTPCYQT